MAQKKSNKLSQILERFSRNATKATGTSMSFIVLSTVEVENETLPERQCLLVDVNRLSSTAARFWPGH